MQLARQPAIVLHEPITYVGGKVVEIPNDALSENCLAFSWRHSVELLDGQQLALLSHWTNVPRVHTSSICTRSTEPGPGRGMAGGGLVGVHDRWRAEEGADGPLDAVTDNRGYNLLAAKESLGGCQLGAARVPDPCRCAEIL